MVVKQCRSPNPHAAHEWIDELSYGNEPRRCLGWGVKQSPPIETAQTKMRRGTEMALAYPGAELTSAECHAVLDAIDTTDKDDIIVELQHKIRGLEHSLAGLRLVIPRYRGMYLRQRDLRVAAERDRDRAEAKLKEVGEWPLFDPNHEQDASCARKDCGHPYYRHFDWMENHAPVGCKYCPCHEFVEAS